MRGRRENPRYAENMMNGILSKSIVGRALRLVENVYDAASAGVCESSFQRASVRVRARGPCANAD